MSEGKTHFDYIGYALILFGFGAEFSGVTSTLLTVTCVGLGAAFVVLHLGRVWVGECQDFCVWA